MKRNYELKVTSSDGTEFVYPVFRDNQNPMQIEASKINVPMSTAAPPTQAGGVYDVRDADGDKVIPHLDWSQGAGQASLDVADASASRFAESHYVDISTPGQIKLARDITDTSDANVLGPVFASGGRVWMGFAVTGSKQIRHSNGGAFTEAAWASTVPTGPVKSFASDGQYTYACIDTGSNSGIYRGSDAVTWSRWSTVAGVTHLVFCGGIPFAVVLSGSTYELKTLTSAGAVDKDVSSAMVVKSGMTTFGLAAGANSVYWGVTGGGTTRVYKGGINYSGGTAYASFEQFAEFPQGFVGTSIVAYAGSVYVGGYYEALNASVGQGAVYLCVSGTTLLLTTLGDDPGDSSSQSQDNRIFSMTAAGKDLYLLTTRRLYRWDIDQGGYSHVCDATAGTAATSSFAWTDTGDFDYTADALPDEGTWTLGDAGATVSVESYEASSYLRFTSSTLAQGAGYHGVPTAGDELDNATGTTLQTRCQWGKRSGWVDASTWNRYAVLQVNVDDGTKRCELTAEHLKADGNNISLRFKITGCDDYYKTDSGDVTIRLTVKGGVGTLYVDGSQVLSSTALEDTDIEGIYFGSYPGGTACFWTRYDYIYHTNDGAFGPGDEYAAPTASTLAVCKGRVWIPYYTSGGAAGYVATALSGTTLPYYDASGASETEAHLLTSTSSFHSGGLLKKFRKLEVVAELPANTSISADVLIDGQTTLGGATATAVGGITTIPVNAEGHNCAVRLYLHSTDGIYTPVVKAINVYWEFQKVWRHTYILDCRAGANLGRWPHDPSRAIEHLMTVCDDYGTFETWFTSYEGEIEKMTFLQAPKSDLTPTEGVVQITVRQL